MACCVCVCVAMQHGRFVLFLASELHAEITHYNNMVPFADVSSILSLNSTPFDKYMTIVWIDSYPISC